MKYILIIIAAIFFAFCSFSQVEGVSKKFDFITSLNMGLTTDFETSNLSGSVTNGVLFNDRVSVALGFGLEENQVGRQMPIYFEGKFMFLKNRDKTPFISVMSGILQPMNKVYAQRINTGFTAGAQIGFQNFFSENFGIATSIGYRYWEQKAESVAHIYHIWPGNISDSYLYISNRFEFRITLLFK